MTNGDNPDPHKKFIELISTDIAFRKSFSNDPLSALANAKIKKTADNAKVINVFSELSFAELNFLVEKADLLETNEGDNIGIFYFDKNLA